VAADQGECVCSGGPSGSAAAKQQPSGPAVTPVVAGRAEVTGTAAADAAVTK